MRMDNLPYKRSLACLIYYSEGRGSMIVFWTSAEASSCPWMLILLHMYRKQSCSFSAFAVVDEPRQALLFSSSKDGNRLSILLIMLVVILCACSSLNESFLNMGSQTLIICVAKRQSSANPGNHFKVINIITVIVHFLRRMARFSLGYINLKPVMLSWFTPTD